MPIETPEVQGAVAAGVVCAGAYLRWAVTPVIAAYEIGKQVGRATPRKPGRARIRVAAIALLPLCLFLLRANIWTMATNPPAHYSRHHQPSRVKKEDARDDWQADAG